MYVETNGIIGPEDLTSEECFLKKEDIREPVPMLWRNRPIVVIGAFQNTYEEICEESVKTNKIDAVGGTNGDGAVYHDLGSLCFNFIMEHGGFTNTDYSAFLRSVVEVLRGTRIQAGISGYSDLVLGNAKIPGSVVRIYKNRVLFHGTLLFSSDLEILSRALWVKQDKLISKGIKSVRSRVAIIAEYLSYDMDVLEFRERLLQALFGESGGREHEISLSEHREIICLTRDKYEPFPWTYGKSPPADLTYGKWFGGSSITVKASLKNLRIEQIRFEDDFLGCMKMKGIEQLPNRVVYERSTVSRVFEKLDIRSYFEAITKEEMVGCIMGDNRVWTHGSETMEQVSPDINGKKTRVSIEENRTLLFVLRGILGLIDAECGCSIGDCGACKVVIDGEAVNSCLVLAWNLKGKKVETVESLSNDTGLHSIQQAFIDAGAVRCRYCIPGTVMSAKALLDRIENPIEEEIRSNGTSNNLRRCTGYVKIVEAIRLTARRMMEAKVGGEKKER